MVGGLLLALLGTTASAPPIAADVASHRVAGPRIVRPVAADSRGWRTPRAEPTSVILVGDSLALEASPFVEFLTAPKHFMPSYYGGTAPCDWVDRELPATRSSVVVITFIGNSLTPCMAGLDGEFLAGSTLVAKYRNDVGMLIDRSRRAGSRIVLVGQPRQAPELGFDFEVEALNEMYRAYAESYHFVSFIDAGAAVESPTGEYTDSLPCTPYDQGCDAGATIAVRGDGVHFCPVAGEFPCSTWSSGALRFAMLIAEAANDPLRFD